MEIKIYRTLSMDVFYAILPFLMESSALAKQARQIFLREWQRSWM